MKNNKLKIIIIFLLLSIVSCKDYDPYSEGTHWTYNIKCENGFVYKILDNRRGTIQVFNSDGTPLKCGKKIY